MSRTLSKMWRCLAVEESDVFMSIWYLIDLIQNLKKSHVHNNTTTTKCGEFFYSFRKIEGLLVLLTEENVANKACWIVICLLLETTNLTTSASTNSFLEWWSFSKKLRQSEGESFFLMTSTTHTATGITPTVTENIITDKNGLLMGSHSTVVVRGVNKQKLRLRAAAVSLRGTVSVMWREDGWTKLASCHLSSVSVTSTCVSHCIFVVRLISTAQVVRGSTLTSARAVATFWTDSAQNHDYYNRFQWFFWVSVPDGVELFQRLLHPWWKNK